MSESQNLGTNYGTDLLDKAEEFLNRYYKEEVALLAQKYPKEQTSLTIDWKQLYRYEMEFSEDLREHPDEIIPILEEALDNIELPVDISLAEATVNVTNLPDTAEFDVGATRSEHRGKLLNIRGQITRISEVKSKATLLAFECKRCGTMNQIPQKGKEQQQPHECGGCERQGPFEIKMKDSDLVDHQLVRLKQPPEKTKGETSGHIDVILEGDLVDSASGGDRITASGILNLTPESDKSLTFEKNLKGTDVQIEETDYEDIDVDEYEDEIEAIASGEYGDPLQLIINSIAPRIHGLDEIKKAIGLQFFGGTTKEYPSGDRDRGDFHILMVGDPGVAKSTLLSSAYEIAPRASRASGKGASKAGMLAAAVRDDFGETEWGLEAGAMVLADKGLACVDEIDKVDDEVVSALHDALESQQVDINKAGINTTLPARTSLLAAGNPKHGRFDPYDPIGEQIELGPTLLSRFDLIFAMKDKVDIKKDEEVARHNINFQRKGVDLMRGDIDEDEAEEIKPAIPHDILRAYIAKAKQEYKPRISEDIEDELVDWYINFRALAEDEDSPIPVTPRFIDALQRLSEAAARARHSNEVESEDVERATKILQRSMRDVGMDPETGQFDADIVETNTSHSQRKRIKQTLQIIKELESESKKGAHLEEIVDRCQENGLDRDAVLHEIENMKQKGDIYSNGNDYFRAVK